MVVASPPPPGSPPTPVVGGTPPPAGGGTPPPPAGTPPTGGTPPSGDTPSSGGTPPPPPDPTAINIEVNDDGSTTIVASDDSATSYEAEKAADQAAQTVEDSEEKHDLTLIIIAAVAGVIGLCMLCLCIRFCVKRAHNSKFTDLDDVEAPLLMTKEVRQVKESGGAADEAKTEVAAPVVQKKTWMGKLKSAPKESTGGGEGQEATVAAPGKAKRSNDWLLHVDQHAEKMIQHDKK